MVPSTGLSTALMALLAVTSCFLISSAVGNSLDSHWAALSPSFAARLKGARGPISPAFGTSPATSARKSKSLTVPAAPSPAREAKSLRNTFPFNTGSNARQAGHGDHDHHHHHEDHDHQSLAPPPLAKAQQPRLVDNRFARQGSGSEEVALDIGTIAAAGEKCIDKVVMVEETEYDDEIHCKHSYSQKCHTTYTTDFEPQQEEECNENFKKRCFIEYKKRALEEKVKFCYTPLVRNCDTPGPEECTTEYQSQCTTRYHEHDVEDDVAECEETFEEKCEDVTQGYTTEQKCSKWPVNKCSLSRKPVKKFSPETECKKVPFELCGPGACPVEQGPEECQDRMETIVQDVPEESCSLEPQRECKHVTKLVPLLKPRENCLDIPKEVCSRRRTSPRKVQKPVVKRWCYTSLGPDTPRPPPPPPIDNEQGKCRAGQRKGPGGRCIEIDNPPVETCSRECMRSIERGECRPDCQATGLCPPCKSTPEPCSRSCETSIRNGECRPECTSNRQCPRCTPKRECSRQCQNYIRNGECRPECNVPECPRCTPKRECSRQCQNYIRNGECRPECNVPECPRCTPDTPPQCSRRCQNFIRNGDCRPECNVPECPRCTANKECSSRCQNFIRNGDCRPECNVPECPSCNPKRECSSRCKNYIRNGDCRPECNVPECPPCKPSAPCARDTCVQKANNNVCNLECSNNPCGDEKRDCEKPATPPPKGYLPPGPTEHSYY